jgi:predicted PurR-regulated permease PerM
VRPRPATAWLGLAPSRRPRFGLPPCEPAIDDAMATKETKSDGASRPATGGSGPAQAAAAVRSFAPTGLFVLALGAVLYLGRSVLIPLAFALMLYFVFRPVVRGLRRIGAPTGIAALFVIVGLTGALGYGAYRLVEPAADWVQRLPGAMRTVERKLIRLRQPVQDVSKLADKVEQIAQVDKSKTAREVVVERPGLSETIFDTAREVGSGAVVMLFAFFFMLVWGDRLLERLVALSPALGGKEGAGAVLSDVERRMSRYLGTITLINTTLGVAVGFGLYLCGLPNPMLWGVVAAVLHFIPYLGGLVGVGLVGLASLITFPTLGQALLPPAVYFGLTALEGNFVSPVLLGRAFRLSPLVIFVWLLLCGWLWGLAGAVVAVPTLMLVKIASEKSPRLAPLAALIEG